MTITEVVDRMEFFPESDIFIGPCSHTDICPVIAEIKCSDRYDEDDLAEYRTEVCSGGRCSQRAIFYREGREK